MDVMVSPFPVRAEASRHISILLTGNSIYALNCLQMRLLMCYVATHPEKLDATKEQQWQKLANLSPEDMTTITNLELIGVPVRKRGKTTGLNFGHKRKRAVRKVGRDQQIAARLIVPLMNTLPNLSAWSFDYPCRIGPQERMNRHGSCLASLPCSRK